MTALPKRLVLCLALLSFACGCTINSAPSDLRKIDRSTALNDALACPPATCKAKPDIESPPFKLQSEKLGEIVREIVPAQARTELVGEDSEIDQMVFVQRSKLFGFADTIWIQTVDLKPHASIIIYSQSNFGFWDLGVNHRRVRNWLAVIETAIITQTGRDP